ncbi:hypothetical protein [Photobacterium leiognathi]|uniref:hypothetical protein n=1 Tax=Photobacterium leiognathi TaxID=553611 RepID=UPI002981908E|nr:hypothetical protein [Photobacterium leiognathi]
MNTYNQLTQTLPTKKDKAIAQKARELAEQKAALEATKAAKDFVFKTLGSMRMPLSKDATKRVHSFLSGQGHGYKKIKQGVFRWFNCRKYQEAIINSPYHYNLDGTQAEPVRQVQKNHAKVVLRQINIRNRAKVLNN